MGTSEDNDEVYKPITSRKEIGTIFYPKAKVPGNGITKTFANDPKRNKEFEAMDLGTYCIMNNISGDMLLKIDGELLNILLQLTSYMEDKVCPKKTFDPEILEKFNKFLEFEELREKMESKR